MGQPAKAIDLKLNIYSTHCCRVLVSLFYCVNIDSTPLEMSREEHLEIRYGNRGVGQILR